jgi:hypothetical protein
MDRVALYIDVPTDQEMTIRDLGRSIRRDWPQSFVRFTDGHRTEALHPAADVPEPGYVGKHRAA